MRSIPLAVMMAAALLLPEPLWAQGAIRVGFIAQSFWTADLMNHLAGQPDMEAVNAGNDCGLANLQRYDVVWIYGNTCWNADTFDQYVQQGGGLIGTPWAINNHQGQIPQCFPIAVPQRPRPNSRGPLNVQVTDPSDPLLQGVEFHNGDSVGHEVYDQVQLKEGATSSVSWNDSAHAVSKWRFGQGRAVYLNFQYITSDCDRAPRFPWGQQLAVNAVRWAAGRLEEVVLAGNATEGVAAALDSMGRRHLDREGYPDPRSARVVLLALDGDLEGELPDYTTQWQTGRHLLVLGGSAHWSGFVSRHLDGAVSQDWVLADDCQPDWSTTSESDLVGLVPETHEFGDQRASGHMVLMAAGQAEGVEVHGRTCHRGPDNFLLASMDHESGGSMVHLSLDVSSFTEEDVERFLEPLLRGYFAYLELRDNRPPAPAPGGPYLVEEGAQVQLEGDARDIEEDAFELFWDLDLDGEFETEGPVGLFSAAGLDGPSEIEVPLMAVDEHGAEGVATATVQVTNLPPRFLNEPPSQAAQAIMYRHQVEAEDPAGELDPLSFELISGPPTLEIDEQSGEIAWVPTAEDVAQWELTIQVSDGDGGLATQTVIFNVVPDPNTPMAAAGMDREVEPGVIFLEGGGEDPRGLPLSFEWEQEAGPEVQLSDPRVPRPWFIATEAAGYGFLLRVSDADYTSPPDHVVITVLDVPPVADAGRCQVLMTGRVSVVDGRHSYDPNGSPLFFVWEQVEGPVNLPINQNYHSPMASFMPETAGVYRFALVVRDGDHESSPDPTTVVANDMAGDWVPAADAGYDVQVPVGETATLFGARSFDPDGQPVSYHWEQSGGEEGILSNADRPTAHFTPPAEGRYTISLTVSDEHHTSLPDMVRVRGLAPDNHPPIAAVVGLGEVLVGQEVVLDASPSRDPDGDGLAYSWSKVEGPMATIFEAQSEQALWIPVFPGLYRFQLQVSDGYTEGDPALVWATAATADNQAPVADAGEEIRDAMAGSPVVLDGRASFDLDEAGPCEEDGDCLEVGMMCIREVCRDELVFQWFQVSGPPVIMERRFERRPTFTPMRWGLYEFMLLVKDVHPPGDGHPRCLVHPGHGAGGGERQRQQRAGGLGRPGAGRAPG